MPGYLIDGQTKTFTSSDQRSVVIPALCCLSLMLNHLLSVNNLFAARTHYLLSLYTAFSFGNFLPTTFIDNVLKIIIRGPGRAENFFLHHRVQNGSTAHPAYHPMGIRGSFPRGKATGA